MWVGGQMNLIVPYYTQTNLNECGFISAKMILEYFDIVVGVNEMRHRLGVIEDRPLLSTEILLLLHMYGLSSTLYSKTNVLNFDISPRYKSILDKNLIDIEKLNLNLIVKKVTISSIKSWINSGIPIICLLNFPNRGLHYVPVVGFDNNNIYIHDFDTPNIKISTDKFKILFENSKTDCDSIVANI
jgi:ABC-type bacteriocin/lantibiotic exporter with double-glycine peptidase domain